MLEAIVLVDTNDATAFCDKIKMYVNVKSVMDFADDTEFHIEDYIIKRPNSSIVFVEGTDLGIKEVSSQSNTYVIHCKAIEQRWVEPDKLS